MKVFIITGLLLFSFTSNGQDAKKYFSYINKAELAIVKNDYKKAIKYYKNAFKNHNSPFNKDYQNALLCNCILDKKEEVKDYFMVLRNRDININGKVESNCRKYIAVEYWSNLYNLPINYSIDTTYRNELKAIFKKDQAIRNYSIQKNPTNHYAHNDDTIRFVDSLNLLELERLIKEKGFPTEAKVGNYLGLYFSVLHNQQWKHNDLDAILYTEVQKGNFSPYQYAYLYDHWIDNVDKGKLSYRISIAYNINGKIYFDYWQEETEIDSLRQKVYMESMEIQHYKILSNKSEEGFGFHGNYIGDFRGLDEVTENRLISGLEESRINYENSKKDDTHTKRKNRKKHRRSN